MWEPPLLSTSLVVTILLSLISTPGYAATETGRNVNPLLQKSCVGKYKGLRIAPDDLARIIVRHKSWHQAYETFYDTAAAMKDVRRANLCGADLSGMDLAWIDLQNADLREVKFQHSNLMWSDFRDADLRGADFSAADLRNASLRYANTQATAFINANLSGANLMGADLQQSNFSQSNLLGANLAYVNLSKAVLVESTLQDANLGGANLSDADFRHANMKNTVYEPLEMPRLSTLALAYSLEQMVYNISPRALENLVHAFKTARFNDKQMAVWVALHRSKLWRGESYAAVAMDVLRYLFFELPTQWGRYPSRALAIIVSQFCAFAFIYFLYYYFSRRTFGVHQSTIDNGSSKGHSPPMEWKFAVISAMQVSLWSALHIGIRGYTLSQAIFRLFSWKKSSAVSGCLRWIALLQTATSVFLGIAWAWIFFDFPIF